MTKNPISTAFAVFMVIAVTSVAIVAPASAQTTSVELAKIWPKWRKLPVSQEQILYAKAKNKGTELVQVYVEFIIKQPFYDVHVCYTDIMWLPPRPERPIVVLEVVFNPPGPGRSNVLALLWYKAEGADWVVDGSATCEFTVT